MKKIFTLVLLLSFIFTQSITQVSANTDSLTEKQKDILIELGYPSDYRAYLDSWYDEVCNYDSSEGGSFTKFGMLCNFVSNMKYTTDRNNLSDFAAIARAVYDEVSNVPARKMKYSMKGIWDSLTNRVLKYDYEYIDAAGGLNSFTDWKNPGVIDPLRDASGDERTREVLLYSYVISFKKHQLGMSSSYPHFKLTNLPKNYCFFYESDRSLEDGELRRGAFIHSKNYITN